MTLRELLRQKRAKASMDGIWSPEPGREEGLSRTEPILREVARSGLSEPWGALEDVTLAPHWAAWHDRLRGLSLVAVGCLVSLAPAGAGRFQLAREACSSLAERLVEAPRPELPFVLGGLGFSPRPGGNGRAHLFVPHRLLVQRAGGPVLEIEHRVAGTPRAAALRVRGWREAATAKLSFRAVPAAADYQETVRKALAAIARGELAKVVLARRAIAELSGQRFAVASILRRLRADHPSAIVFGFGRAGRAFVGATPETLAEVAGQRLRTQALAGTGAPESLLSSDKDRREHQHVVDDIMAALAPLSSRVWAAEAPRLVQAGRLTHLGTPIEAELEGHLLDAVGALHPTAALSGVPRQEAARFIATHEAADRGWYGGPVGWLAPDGRGHFAVAIRSATVTQSRVEAWAGAGIVAGSAPEREWRETEDKLHSMKSALCLEAS